MQTSGGSSSSSSRPSSGKRERPAPPPPASSMLPPRNPPAKKEKKRTKGLAQDQNEDIHKAGNDSSGGGEQDQEHLPAASADRGLVRTRAQELDEQRGGTTKKAKASIFPGRTTSTSERGREKREKKKQKEAGTKKINLAVEQGDHDPPGRAGTSDIEQHQEGNDVEMEIADAVDRDGSEASDMEEEDQAAALTVWNDIANNFVPCSPASAGTTAGIFTAGREGAARVAKTKQAGKRKSSSLSTRTSLGDKTDGNKIKNRFPPLVSEEDQDLFGGPPFDDLLSSRRELLLPAHGSSSSVLTDDLLDPSTRTAATTTDSVLAERAHQRELEQEDAALVSNISVLAFPGFVQNHNKALELLGGIGPVHTAIVSPSLNESANLYCRLGDQNRYMQPIGPAKKKSVNHILTARNKKTGTLRFLGHCLYQFDFDTLADFHYCPPKGLDYGKIVLDLARSNNSSPTSSSMLAGHHQAAHHGGGGTTNIDAILNMGITSTAPTSTSGGERLLMGASSGGQGEAKMTTKKSSATISTKRASSKQNYKEIQQLLDHTDNALYYLPPPCFTKTSYPLDYNFEENPHAQETDDIQVKRSWIPLQRLKCDTVEIPQTAPEGADVEAYFHRVEMTNAVKEKELLEQLMLLFEERPIWIRAALLSRIEDKSLHVTWWLQRALQAISYIWENGPYRGSHCKLGYDPRLSYKDAIYQVIDFRDELLKGPQIFSVQKQAAAANEGGATQAQPQNSSGMANSGQHHAGNSNQASGSFPYYAPASNRPSLLDVHFRVPPTNRSQLYQICDLEDEPIQKIVEKRIRWLEKHVVVKSTIEVGSAAGGETEEVDTEVRKNNAGEEMKTEPANKLREDHHAAAPGDEDKGVAGEGEVVAAAFQLDRADHYGWLGEACLRKIRDRMQVKSALLRESGTTKKMLQLQL
ncbi:unnamed protein product [Amoebophrya sp. A120]|nr:unnamed protein product [Amoebophrya sp. A120]|eukprot:GSA120T00009103001.1